LVAYYLGVHAKSIEDDFNGRPVWCNWAKQKIAEL